MFGRFRHQLPQHILVNTRNLINVKAALSSFIFAEFGQEVTVVFQYLPRLKRVGPGWRLAGRRKYDLTIIETDLQGWD
jgi:hypothetical protein